MLVSLNPSLYLSNDTLKLPTYQEYVRYCEFRKSHARRLCITGENQQIRALGMQACACLALVSLQRPIADKVAARATTVPCAPTHLISLYFYFCEIRQVLQYIFKKCLNSTYLEQSLKLVSFLYKIFKQNLHFYYFQSTSRVI